MMRTLLDCLIAFAAALVIGAAWLFAVAYGVAHSSTCPPHVHTCDVGPSAGIFLGLVTWPFVSMIAWYLILRLLDRRRQAKITQTVRVTP